jgi:hypothetical protein
VPAAYADKVLEISKASCSAETPSSLLPLMPTPSPTLAPYQQHLLHQVVHQHFPVNHVVKNFKKNGANALLVVVK